MTETILPSGLRANAIAFTVYGKAQPAGSKRAIPVHVQGKPLIKNGRMVTRAIDSNPNTPQWKAAIAAASRDAYSGPLIDGPVRLTVRIFRVRPKKHYRTGRNAHLLRDDAPEWPTSAPDNKKLVRAIEDALNRVLWIDDSRVVDQRATKQWGESECVEIIVEPMFKAEPLF